MVNTRTALTLRIFIFPLTVRFCSIYAQNINRMGFETEAVLLLCVN